VDHISIPVADVSRTKVFYEALLIPLGWTCSGWRNAVFVGFKKPGAPALYFGASSQISQVHLAFKAANERAVVRFHYRALEVGGVDNGEPGPRPDYGASYYAAFILDPDGHNVEAVWGGVG
jgi:catechol 2,3-dioxygenase-like lactoylglutathione lyase family enzyme